MNTHFKQMGQENLATVAGPIARSISSCQLFMRAALEHAAKFDPNALPFPFDEKAGKVMRKRERKLVVGIARTKWHGFALQQPLCLALWE